MLYEQCVVVAAVSSTTTGQSQGPPHAGSRKETLDYVVGEIQIRRVGFLFRRRMLILKGEEKEKFFVWSWKDCPAARTRRDARLFCSYITSTAAGNFLRVRTFLHVDPLASEVAAGRQNVSVERFARAVWIPAQKAICDT